MFLAGYPTVSSRVLAICSATCVLYIMMACIQSEILCYIEVMMGDWVRRFHPEQYSSFVFAVASETSLSASRFITSAHSCAETIVGVFVSLSTSHGSSLPVSNPEDAKIEENHIC